MEAHNVLCVPRDASEAQIRKAYKNLVRPSFSPSDLILTYMTCGRCRLLDGTPTEISTIEQAQQQSLSKYGSFSLVFISKLFLTFRRSTRQTELYCVTFAGLDVQLRMGHIHRFSPLSQALPSCRMIPHHQQLRTQDILSSGVLPLSPHRPHLQILLQTPPRQLPQCQDAALGFGAVLHRELHPRIL